MRSRPRCPRSRTSAVGCGEPVAGSHDGPDAPAAGRQNALDGSNLAKRHANPPPEKRGLVHLRRVAEQAFPDCSIRFFSHGTLGGHRAPRINTLAFRLVDARGRFRSNVIWVAPQDLRGWTADDVRRAVGESNGE